ncbi:MAG: prepilin-type N-terminal cleavage/methylation domain-containing protein [Bacilli bacterium]|nr:prepilin-type N-terminal cleavage/methylation domain-containing protein [Bacilli bacterium]
MNKKGFTLVEILSVIVLISLLLGLGIPGVMKISENMKKKSLNTKIKLIEEAGVFWGQDNKTLLQSITDCEIDDSGAESNCYKISISSLISEDYLDKENNSNSYMNPVNNKDLAIDENCKVHVYKKNNRVYAYFGKKSCANSID